MKVCKTSLHSVLYKSQPTNVLCYAACITWLLLLDLRRSWSKQPLFSLYLKEIPLHIPTWSRAYWTASQSYISLARGGDVVTETNIQVTSSYWAAALGGEERRDTWRMIEVGDGGREGEASVSSWAVAPYEHLLSSCIIGLQDKERVKGHQYLH